MESQKSAPKLSIVMPVFNQTEALKEMVDSILASTFKDWELLAVDDGSKEDTLSVLNQYAIYDSRIRVFYRKEQPKGAQTCRNIGLKEAIGEYIIFFDSDDIISPSCLQIRVEGLDSRPDLDFMVFPSSVLEDGKKANVPSYLWFGYKTQEDIPAFLKRNLPFVVWNNIYRLSALRDRNISWDANLLSLQDADFNLTALLSGLSYDYAQCEPTMYYRIEWNKNSVSKKTTSSSHFESHLYAVDKFYRVTHDNVGNKYRNSLYYGALNIYNKACENGLNYDFAEKLVATIRRYDSFHANILMVQINVSKFLERFVSPKIARQVPMCHFLFMRNRARKRKAQAIEKIIRNQANQSV